MFSAKTNIKKTRPNLNVKKKLQSDLIKECFSVPNIPWKQISVAKKPTSVNCIQFSAHSRSYDLSRVGMKRIKFVLQDNFLSQVVEDPTRKGALLDLVFEVE
ncbi:hypothetical protein GDO86_009521 [Hymenochirus boettgeri]|uniref:Uncharacterized protein n=1 Tax=Hymenochirus boettgeri TaxID=247094 RepID=A0A8T2JLZ7_9PIPI|nr:hypothetical protein GDO86_009521 [Hymenochirus boettgeri]